MSEIKLPVLWMPSAFKNSYSKQEMKEYGKQAVILDRLEWGDELQEAKRQLAALTEDYKDLEAQLLAVGAGGVSKLIGDSE